MNFRLIPITLGGGEPMWRLFLIALGYAALGNSAAQGTPKDLPLSPIFTSREVGRLPAPPREGISTPTNGPVAEDLIPLGAAEEISPNSDGQFALAGYELILCGTLKVNAKLSGGCKRLRCVYLPLSSDVPLLWPRMHTSED